MNDRDKERKLELANKKLLVELGDIHLQLLRNVGKIISLKYHRKLYDEAKTKFKTIKAEDISEEVRKKAAEIFQTFILINKFYVNKITDGKFSCTNEDLNLLEENCKEVLKKIDAVNKNYPEILSDSECSDTKEGIKKTRRELIPIAREFADINSSYRNFDKENFSWQKLKNLYYQAEKEAAISRPAEWLSEFAENQKMWFFGEITFMIFEGVEEVDKGADMPPNFYPSTAEELNFLQKIADEFPKFLNWSKKKYDFGEVEGIEDKIQWAKEANEKLKTFIQEERKKRGLSAPTNKSTNNQPNSPQNTQQVQNLQKEINDLNQKVTELQNQIKELLAKQEKEPLDSNTKQEIQQKVANLENQKEQIQNKLKQKQSQQEKVKQQSVNTQQPENEFNWLYVVIPGAVLLVVMGIIIAYLVGKRSKKA